MLNQGRGSHGGNDQQRLTRYQGNSGPAVEEFVAILFLGFVVVSVEIRKQGDCLFVNLLW
jgi:hypothetical protein